LPDLQFTVPPNPVCSEIDAVYLWVNGSDPLVAEQYRSVYGVNLTVDNRLRDIPLLKYSFRALATYAPFIRNLILVTNGQVPYWLNTSNPRVRLVTHREIFEHPEYLPTFNSNAIESQLSRIPGIAPCWFSFNDDFAFGRPVNLEDWMDLNNGTQKLNFKLGYYSPALKHIKKKKPYDISVAHSNLLVNRFYYPEDFDPVKTNITNVKHKNLYEGHGVRFIQQKVIEGLYQRFHEEFVETSKHRKRFLNDTVMSFLYNQYAMREHNASLSEYLCKSTIFKMFYGKPQHTINIVSQFFRDRPTSWCMNDDAPASNAAKKRIRELNESIRILIELMENEFPLPSEFEKVKPDEIIIPRTLQEWHSLYRIYPYACTVLSSNSEMEFQVDPMIKLEQEQESEEHSQESDSGF